MTVPLPPASGQAPPLEPPTRLLRRPPEGRMAFGVAAGLARYLGVDVVLVRIAFLALTVLGGSGILLYLLGVLVIPEQRPGEEAAVGAPRAASSGPAVVLGVGLVVLGVASLFGQLLPGLSSLTGPVLLVVLGVAVLVVGGRR
jgi:phage shock protein C